MHFLPIIFISLLAFAEDDLAVETYCFPSGKARLRVEKKLSSVLVSSDKMESENDCLTVQMKPHRRELLQNFARNLDREMAVKFSSAELRRDPCRLLVEKIRLRKTSTNDLQVSKIPAAAQTQSEEASRDLMQVLTLEDFSLTVGPDSITGKCRYVTADSYEIQIIAIRDPKPIAPPNLAPGTLVAVQNRPEDQKTVSVSTSLRLSRGERVEIGGIVKQIWKKNQAIDLRPEVSVEMVEGSEEEKVFFSIQ